MTRCAIYTRKSSDEGLDQQFNSLDAQREACEAYVLSQAGEGWIAAPERYDDGGWSGGNMDRPAIRQLLDDVRNGKVDIIVVYKVDRLTRSLADFARIVDILDSANASFVSVTQAFNTTTSMGRLTLNVLLSFAQFEREVTGERIRDKIAASKAKGMWMGGLPPLGYDPPDNSDRILRVNEAEAEAVRAIFRRYLELSSVHMLVADLADRGITSKVRVKRDGLQGGGQPFSRGALFHLLRNPVYRGAIVHKGVVHQGRHDAIVPAELYDAVQSQLASTSRRRGHATRARAPLTGRLFLADGTRLTPTHSRGASGRTYHYYVPVTRQVGRSCVGASIRLPARRFEARLRSLLDGLAAPTDEPLDLIERIDLHRDRLALTLPGRLWPVLRGRLAPEHDVERHDDHLTWSVPFLLGSRAIEIEAKGASARRDAVLIRALRTAHAMLTHDRRGQPVLSTVPRPRYDRRLVRLAFLSPALQVAIAAGTQPPALTLEKIVRGTVPLDWDEQARWAQRRS